MSTSIYYRNVSVDQDKFPNVFSALPGKTYCISQSIHSYGADDFAFYFTDNKQAVRRKYIYLSTTKLTSHKHVYLYHLSSSCYRVSRSLTLFEGTILMCLIPFIFFYLRTLAPINILPLSCIIKYFLLKNYAH